MSQQFYPEPARSNPIRNMRIIFWGVRGSCQFFPSNQEVREYSRRIAIATLIRVRDDLISRSENGHRSIRDLLGGFTNQEALEAYRHQLGIPELPVYGGETTCVQIETSDGHILILDGGSGIRHCAKHLAQTWPDGKPRVLHFFGTHEHLDHRSGIAFSRFCFHRPQPFTLHVYGTYQFLNALDDRYGIFSHTIKPTTYLDDPIDYTMMSAVWKGTEIRNPDDLDDQAMAKPPPWDVRDISQPLQIGRTTITAFNVYHGPTRCLAYEIRHNDITFLFCTDHEVRRGPDPADPRQHRSEAAEQRLIRHSMNVDLAYYDGQYFLAEYLGLKGISSSPPIPRIDWGHGCIEDILERVEKCGVKRALIGHHDPEREWPEQVEMDGKLAAHCRDKPYRIELAKGSSVIDL